jgi:hypothetical protein
MDRSRHIVQQRRETSSGSLTPREASSGSGITVAEMRNDLAELHQFRTDLELVAQHMNLSPCDLRGHRAMARWKQSAVASRSRLAQKCEVNLGVSLPRGAVRPSFTDLALKERIRMIRPEARNSDRRRRPRRGAARRRIGARRGLRSGAGGQAHGCAPLPARRSGLWPAGERGRAPAEAVAAMSCDSERLTHHIGVGKRGTAASSSAVCGCCGLANTWSIFPASQTSPDRITSTSSAIWCTTDKSCEIRR